MRDVRHKSLGGVFENLGGFVLILRSTDHQLDRRFLSVLSLEATPDQDSHLVRLTSFAWCSLSVRVCALVPATIAESFPSSKSAHRRAAISL